MDEDNKKLTFSKDQLLGSIYPPDIADELKHLSITFDIVSNNGFDNSILLTGQTILNYNLYNEAC